VASVKKFLYSLIDAYAETGGKKHTTEDLRQHALSYGWPIEIVNSMTISASGEVKFSNPIYKNAAETLEYGTIDIDKSPAIRTYMMGIK
jgi:hypothetical protein